MLKSQSELTRFPVSNFSAGTARRTPSCASCRARCSTACSSKQVLRPPSASQARSVQEEDLLADRLQSVVIPASLASVLNAKRDEVARIIVDRDLLVVLDERVRENTAADFTVDVPAFNHAVRVTAMICKSRKPAKSTGVNNLSVIERHAIVVGDPFHLLYSIENAHVSYQ
ncbi:unnamed protein product [Phytophthora lilii]|uniref:Unnamed protein product n=1 Tax=Phytophthora lilii TaxID=2077276 RepID=A0A9W7CKI2_9STRA|nr:unnamed protein product [Phytophthora lilii]